MKKHERNLNSYCWWNKPIWKDNTLYDSNYMTPWRRRWYPTPALLPGKSHEWRSLVGCSPWSCKESDMTSDFTFTFHFHALEKEMATHSSVLARRIPGTGEPGGLLSMGSHRVGHDWSDLAAAAAAAFPLHSAQSGISGLDLTSEMLAVSIYMTFLSKALGWL